MNEAVDKLNKTVKCFLAPSDIHGIGVFTLRDIKVGDKLYCTDLEVNFIELTEQELASLRPEIRRIIKQRWSLATGIINSPNGDARLISFMNHSDDPNYNKFSDTAVRDIKKGEEVTEHYGEIRDESIAL